MSARPLIALIVEDSKAFSDALREFLTLCIPQFEVHEARTGASALEQLPRLQPRLILMDIQLPDMNGLEVTRRIKAQAPDTEVIAMSMMDGQRVAEKALAAGATGFISKDHLFHDLEPLLARFNGPHQKNKLPLL